MKEIIKNIILSYDLDEQTGSTIKINPESLNEMIDKINNLVERYN